MTKQKNRLLIAGVLACVSSIAALGADFLVRTANARVIQERLDSLATEVSGRVLERIGTYEYGLRGARGLVIGSSAAGLTHETFRRYAQSRDIGREFPGSRGFGYIARVPEAEENDFVARARLDGRPGFSIKQLSPHSGERFVILYLEPEDLNKEAIGLDIASERNRRDAAFAAMVSGNVALTGPITLVQASGKAMSGFLMLLPVYREGSRPLTQAERSAGTIGWTYTPIVIDEVLSSLPDASEGYSLSLYDASDAPVAVGEPGPAAGERPPPGIRFFGSRGEASIAALARIYPGVSLTRTLRLPVYSRDWVVEVSATSAFLARLRLIDHRLAAATGAALSILIVASLYLVSQNGRKKKQGRVESERLAALVENSSDAIVSHTRSGIISSWNRSAETMFGYPVSEAVGRDFAETLLPLQRLEEDRERLASAIGGDIVSSYSSVCLHRNGSPVDVSMTMAPIMTADGHMIGIVRTIRNIGEAKSFEAKLIELNNALERQVRERTAALDERNRQLELTGNSFLRIIESSPYALLMVDGGGTIKLVNGIAESIFGYARAELIGRSIETLVPDRFRPGHPGLHGDFMRDPKSRPMGQGRDLFARRKDGSELPIEIGLNPLETPEGLNVIVAVIDISQRKQQENRIQRFSAFQEAVLSYAGFAVIATDADGIITLFNPAAEKMLGYSALEMVGVSDPGKFHDATEVARRADELSAELKRDVAVGFPAFIANVRPGEAEEREWTYIRKDGTRLPVLVKISALLSKRSEIFGYLGMAVDLTERNENSRKLAEYSGHLEELVTERTKELESTQRRLLAQERLQRELRLAAEIQESLLPRAIPRTARYDIALYAKPARFISGDIYDVIVKSDDSVYIFLADISGKGIPAALMTTAARTLFAQGARRDQSPAAILAEIDALLSHDLAASELFMTCLVCRLDYRSGEILYVNAGHTETIVHRPSGRSGAGFVPTGLPVGLGSLAPGMKAAEQSLPLLPGDIVVFYSDGLTEMTDSRDEQFGIDRVKAIVARNADADSQEVMDAILRESKEFGGEKEPDDDTSIIAVRILPSVISEAWSIPFSEMDALVDSLVRPCRAYGQPFSYEFELLATELTSNVFNHAYGMDSEHPSGGTAGAAVEIRTELSLRHDGITLDLRDRGSEFTTPGGIGGRSPSPEDLSEGGYGLSLLSRLSDEIVYERTDDGSNHWHIVKRLKETDA
jgi:PAS domain S-box-containing protein